MLRWRFTLKISDYELRVMINLILVSLAVIFTLVGGFNAYQKYNSITDLDAEIEELETQIDSKSDSAKTLNQETDELAEEEEDVRYDLDQKDSELSTLKDQKEELKNTDYSEYDEAIEEKEELLAQTEEKIEQLEELEPQLEELKEVEEEIASSEQEVEVVSKQIAFLEKKTQAEQDYKERLDAKRENVEKQISSPTVKAKVIQVNEMWNLITLDKGNSAGVVEGSSLYVYRGSDKIATLNVKTLLSQSSVGEVIDNESNSAVRPGDIVVSVLK